ncbi:MAG: hypothetical protein ACRCXZ_09855 [Patescibacteria group bacterium]
MSLSVTYSKPAKLDIKSQIDMISSLADLCVPVNIWGEHRINDLWEEIELGESNLYVNFKNKVERWIKVVNITVIHNEYILAEDFQYYPILGRSYWRPQHWVSEKIKHEDESEDSFEAGLTNLNACRRALKEELNIRVINRRRFEYIGTETQSKESGKYPGLLTVSSLRKFKIELDGNEFNPNGYEENVFNEMGDLERKSSFTWLKNNPNHLTKWTNSRKFTPV